MSQLSGKNGTNVFTSILLGYVINQTSLQTMYVFFLTNYRINYGNKIRKIIKISFYTCFK